MSDCKVIGLDIAKSIFHIVGINEHGKEVIKQSLRRKEVLAHLSNIPSCLIALESCASCHYWFREIKQLGHEVKIIAAQYVKPYVRRQKNDFNDARAIAEAASREDTPSVPTKNREQQYVQMTLKIRSSLIDDRTRLGNQIRAMLYEQGLIIREGVSSICREVPQLLDAENIVLTEQEKIELQRLYQRYLFLKEEIAYYDKLIALKARDDERAQRLMAIPGVGVLSAMAVLANLGNPSCFKNGRHYAAYLGLVPRQFSSGGKTVLGRITKQGNNYLRQLLIHGARSALNHSARYDDVLSVKLEGMKQRMHRNKVSVALANKNARIIWAMLSTGDDYQRVICS